MNSASKEDYLKNIYKLSHSVQKMGTSALAKNLSVSPASVSEMISKLSKEGLISNIPYYGFKLTEKGEIIAINLIRKHRLIEVFLKETLNYPNDEVHPEAEKIEHSVSDEFVDKLEKFLGYPKFDPHGDPIPDRSGNLIETDDICLLNAKPGKKYFVTKIPDYSKEILAYLSEIGIALNSKVYVNEKFSLDESLTITFKKRTYLLSKTISEKIFVKRKK